MSKLATLVFLSVQAMQHLGITGGIGSGKTTVCRIFEKLGIPVYYADDRAKALMVADESLKTAITKVLGEQAYLESGDLNRPWIAQQVFGDAQLLEALNGLVHPAVARDGLQWQAEQATKGVPFTLREAALLYESGIYKTLDKIIVVSAPENVRVRRVMERDGVTEAAVRSRIDRQMPEAEKVAKADYVIDNSGQQPLIPQVVNLYRRLKHGIYA